MEENSPDSLPQRHSLSEEDSNNPVIEIEEHTSREEVTLSADQSDSGSLLTTDQTYSSSSEEDETSEDDEDDEEEGEESLANSIMQDIQAGTYTCLVCTSEIDAFSKIWSCDGCYRVYDLDCIRDWATRGSSTDKSKKNWRCPACNIETNSVPKKFTCWCGKVTNPNPNQLMPFSCGNPCNEPYKECIHSCGSQCHPAMHPVCGAMGPMMKCACGKSERQLPCLITPYKDGWQCNSPCDTVLCTSGHKCKGACHSGFCGPCDESVPSKCYCGKSTVDVLCSDRLPKKCHDQSGENWIGYTECKEITTIFHDCGVHSEEFSCQPLPEQTPICKFSPTEIKTCHCGKTKVDPLKRTKCTDEIPECENVCGKVLPCGCQCKMKCHSGECVCFNVLEKSCSCGNQDFLVRCSFLQAGYTPKCKHKCSVLLNCRKHYHKEICCSYEQVGLKREREKKKAVRNGIRSSLADDNEIMTIEPAHICTRTCNRLKSCGLHQCEGLCHNGPCGVCLESSSEDLVCHCGKTVIPAPVRCGTKIECHEQCRRPKDCGHRLEPHKCHENDIECPKCTKLVTKECNCGSRKEMPNVLCSQTNVSCGRICQVPKNCGHACLKVCSEKCTKDNVHSSSTLCQSMCNSVRINCPHLCKQKCHFNKVGKSKKCDATICSEPILLKCSCGRKSKSVKCGSSLNDTSRIGDVLECDEECLSAIRDAELKKAFNLTNEQLSLEEEILYPDSVLTVFEKQRNWCSRVETKLREFVQQYTSSVDEESDDSLPKVRKSYHFPPGSSPQRKFIHELADSYKLYSESQDKEPQRSVFIVITPYTTIPVLSISSAIQRKREIIAENTKAEELKQNVIQESKCNAILIQDAFFGITKDELDKELKKVLETTKLEGIEIQWLKGSSYVATSPQILENVDEIIENDLYLLMKSFKSIIRDKSLAFDCKLCLVDKNVEYILKTDEKLRVKEKPVEVTVDGFNTESDTTSIETPSPESVSVNEEEAANLNDTTLEVETSLD
ncbi:FKBP12-associated protein 1 [[Candida] anglica]|uniref:FKBP12-associated protein 1 n=1 Tax=[Candida] anglica TaxID=148631 RepID=A0ABP0ENK4_9ASCO